MKDVLAKYKKVEVFLMQKADRIMVEKPGMKDIQEDEVLVLLFNYGYRILKSEKMATEYRRTEDLQGKEFFALNKKFIKDELILMD